MKEKFDISKEKALVARLQNGDQKALSDIYDLYSEALYGLCLKVLRSHTGMAEDAFQEAMVKIWKYAASYDPEKGRLFTWMLNITRNTAIDYWRKMDKRSQIQEDISDVHISHPNMVKNPDTDTIDVTDQLDNLSSEERDVIELAYFSGMTHHQISGQLKLPLGTVKTRIRRGITKLKKIYNVV